MYNANYSHSLTKAISKKDVKDQQNLELNIIFIMSSRSG